MPARPKTESKPLNLPDLSGLTLLVVDDHDDSVDALASFLHACGAHVLPARTGSAALAYVDTTPQIDAIVTDLAMPGMSGIDLLKKVRAHPQRSQLPVIALTGYYEDYANAEGFEAFLKKPVDLDQLCTAVLTLVGRQ
jgi:two-component system, chemotaxis family, CheB/CheR fusion protein